MEAFQRCEIYTPQPNLLTPLMGACDGFVKAALSATLPYDPCGEKIPLGAVRSSVTRIDVLIHHFLMIHAVNGTIF